MFGFHATFKMSYYRKRSARTAKQIDHYSEAKGTNANANVVGYRQTTKEEQSFSHIAKYDHTYLLTISQCVVSTVSSRANIHSTQKCHYLCVLFTAHTTVLETHRS